MRDAEKPFPSGTPNKAAAERPERIRRGMVLTQFLGDGCKRLAWPGTNRGRTKAGSQRIDQTLMTP